MSIAELISQAEKLSHEDQLSLLRALETKVGPALHGELTSKPVRWPDIRERQKAIYGDQILTNMVLWEREQSN